MSRSRSPRQLSSFVRLCISAFLQIEFFFYRRSERGSRFAKVGTPNFVDDSSLRNNSAWKTIESRPDVSDIFQTAIENLGLTKQRG